MPQSDDRYHGFLTDDDHEHLQRGLEELPSGEKKRVRYGIRQRAARAIRDLVILERELPEGDDRGKIFEAVFKEDGLWSEVVDDSARRQDKLMRDLFTFLIDGYNGYWGDKTGRPVEGRADQWMKRGLQAAYPESYVSVVIERADREQLDEWEDEVRDEDGVVTDEHDLFDTELQALLQTGRIDVEEYESAGPESIL